MAEVLSNTPQGYATFHFANVSKCKCSKAPGQTKKRLFPPKEQLRQSETAPTKMRRCILSIPAHPCYSHCSLLTGSRAHCVSLQVGATLCSSQPSGDRFYHQSLVQWEWAELAPGCAQQPQGGAWQPPAAHWITWAAHKTAAQKIAADSYVIFSLFLQASALGIRRKSVLIVTNKSGWFAWWRKKFSKTECK